MMRRCCIALVSLGFAVALVSCPNPLANKDLRQQIQDEVKVATAAEHVLTIESNPGGVVSPSGSQVVKDGIPVSLSATVFPAYGVIGWKQTGGSGTVKFSQTGSGVIASLTGGDASVAAIFVEKPRVLYSTPIGNNIYKNTTVAVFFSRQVDFETINMDSLKVLRNGTEQITVGSFSATADGKSVRFDPSSDLDPFSNYIIDVTPAVKAVLNVDDYRQGNVLITDPSLGLAAEYTGAFMTNNSLDNVPPTAGAFTVASASGDPTYTGSSGVLLSAISANDDNGIASVLVRNKGAADYQFFSYDPANPTVRWSVPVAASGPATIQMSFEDPYQNRTVSDTERTIVVDVQKPSGSVTINGGEFTRIQSVNLSLSAADPDIQTSPVLIKGSGESATGSDTVNRKQMRLSNSSAGIATAAWEPYDTALHPWTLADASEGLKAVYAQYADGVGNVSDLFYDQVYVDPTPPSGSYTLLDGTLVTSPRIATLAISASDGAGSGLGKFEIDPSSSLKDGSSWSITGFTGTFSSATGSGEFTLPTDGKLTVELAEGADGPRTVILKVKDQLGNVGTITNTITLDTTPPPAGALRINNGAAATNTPNVTLYLTIPSDTGSGVPYMGFSNTTTPPTTWVPVAPRAAWVMGSAPGTQWVYVWFKDGAGNYSTTGLYGGSNARDDILLDITPPSGTISATPSPTAGLVTIYCNATDAVSMYFSNNSAGPWYGTGYGSSYAGWSLTSATYGGSPGGGAADNVRTVYAKFRDSANNYSLVTSTTVLLDTTGPTSTVVIASGAAWTKSSTVTLTLTATDTNFAAANLQMRFSNDNTTWSTWEPFAASKSWDMTSSLYGGTTVNTASKYVYVQVEDPLGNTSTVSDTIGFDTTAPTFSYPAFALNSGATYTNSNLVTINVGTGWTDPAPTANSSPSRMRFSNSSSGPWSGWYSYTSQFSGWDMTSASYGGTAATGYKYVYVQVGDTLANISSATYDYIYYDTSIPTGSISIAAGVASTSTTPVSVGFTFSDTITSGAQMQIRNESYAWSAWEPYAASRTWYLAPGNGNKTVSVQFKDAAGNLSSVYSDTISLTETYASIGGQDIWGTYPTPNNAASLAYMSTAAIDGGLSPYPMAVGSVLVFYTSSGAYGKLTVTNFQSSVLEFPLTHNDVLSFSLVVYAADGISVARSTSGHVDSNYEYYFDLDTGTQGGGTPDFRWYASGSYGALVPQNGARFDKWN